MSVNTQSPDVSESPIITGMYGKVPLDISLILLNDIEFLNSKLEHRNIQKQLDILSKSGFHR
jgi:hypothetical protein